jgi:antitoxin component of MazEF toxin-antitoxin module
VIARQSGIDERNCLPLADNGNVGGVLRPIRRKYDLAERVAGITPKNRHPETDWGRPRDKESW